MNLANVTNIMIPEGNVVKIHETNSGRVLWQKKINPPIEDNIEWHFLTLTRDGVRTFLDASAVGNLFLSAFNDLATNPAFAEHDTFRVMSGDKFTYYRYNGPNILVKDILNNFPNYFYEEDEENISWITTPISIICEVGTLDASGDFKKLGSSLMENRFNTYIPHNTIPLINAYINGNTVEVTINDTNVENVVNAAKEYLGSVDSSVQEIVYLCIRFDFSYTEPSSYHTPTSHLVTGYFVFRYR